MRTRILNKMRNCEVEQYLDNGGDTIFIAVGTVELHGDFPLDCETVCIEAICEKMAKAANGLAMTGLPFFYPGATRIGRGTVYMSIQDGVNYLSKISDSLLQQGFRKQIYVTGHGPAYLSVNTHIMDAFHRHSVPFVHISLIQAINIARENGWEGNLGSYSQMMYGAYKQLNQLNYLYVDADARQIDSLLKSNSPQDSTMGSISYLQRLATTPGNVGFYYENFSEHGGGEGCRTIEQLHQKAENGEKLIDSFIHYFNPQKVVDAIEDIDRKTQEIILEKYPHLRGGVK